MNVFKCVVKVLALAGLVSLVGCVSMDRLSSVQLRTEKSGVLYGFNIEIAAINPSDDIKALCKTISNKDDRCANPENYGSIEVISKIGFSDGGMGALAVYDKKLITPGAGCNSYRTESAANKSCTFYKVIVEPNKLATVVEVASSPTKNTGNCTWDSINGWGGTVCPAYGWDYHKNGEAMVGFVYF